MRIVIGTDHRGFQHKTFIKNNLQLQHTTIEWLDVGAFNDERSDYPVYAQQACLKMLNGEASKGVLLCGSGVGMAIAANRFAHIYAALAWNADVARSCAQEDKANILVIPADYVSCDQAVAMLQAWLLATFRGGRYQERISLIDAF